MKIKKIGEVLHYPNQSSILNPRPISGGDSGFLASYINDTVVVRGVGSAPATIFSETDTKYL